MIDRIKVQSSGFEVQSSIFVLTIGRAHATWLASFIENDLHSTPAGENIDTNWQAFEAELGVLMLLRLSIFAAGLLAVAAGALAAEETKTAVTDSPARDQFIDPAGGYS